MEINLCVFDIFNPGASVFLESPSNFSGPKSCFMFAMFAFSNFENDTCNNETTS